MKFKKRLILAIVLSVLALGFILTSTTTGLKLNLAIIKQIIPGQLTIGNVEGKLSDFSLNNITYENEQTHLTIKTLRVNWQPLWLLSKKIKLNVVQFKEADIIIAPAETDSESASFDTTLLTTYLNLDEINFDQVTLHHPHFFLEINGSVKNKWNLSWNLNIAKLNALAMNTKGALKTTGTIVGGLKTPIIHSRLSAEQLEIEHQKITTLNGEIHIEVKPKTTSSIQINATNLTLNEHIIPKMDLNILGNIFFQKNTLIVQIESLLNQQYRAMARFSFPKFSLNQLANQNIDGKINFNISQWDLLTSLVPEIKYPEGNLGVELFLAGNLSTPQFKGKATLANAKLSLPILGIAPNDIQAQAIFDIKKINLAGQFRSGQGQGNLKGTLDLEKAGYPLSLEITGESLEVINLKEYKTLISPNVTLDFANGRLTVKGKLDIPKAEIKPSHFDSLVTLPNEVIFVNEPTQAPTLPFQTELQLHIQLGKEIQIAIQGLQGRLEGQLELTQNSSSLTTAIGELSIDDGMYKAYGQRLKINSGQLTFTGGSVMNPGLNITASKQIRAVTLSSKNGFSTGGMGSMPGSNQITVGVRVQGVLNKPIFSLYSNPTMNQQDVLSYLVLGYPQSQASSQQTSLLLSALSALNPNAGSFSNLTDTLQNTLGLSELSVESTQVFNPSATGDQSPVTSTTTVGVGKELAKNLYLHYSMGLFEQVAILNLRYQFKPNWAIQSENSTVDNGVDLLYSFERD